MSRLVALARHWRAARTALSTLGHLYSEDSEALDALGGLTDEEVRAVVRWATNAPGMTIVEIGTLFGLTAHELSEQVVVGRVIAVDDFSWNPFGIPPDVHEAFTRRILRGTKVEIVRMTSAAWRENAKEVPDMIFFDADHRYEVVKKELEWAKAKGVKIIAGHDYGNPNPRFGVTRAVDEVLGPPDEVVGMCWMKKG